MENYKLNDMYLKRLFGILLIMAISVTGAFAQLLPQEPQQQPQQEPTEVTDNEIAQFALAFRDLQLIDQKVQQDMVNAVQEKGVDVQRFNEYLTAQQDPAQEMEAAEDELEKFASAYQAIEKIQGEAEKEMQKAITDNNLSIERYQEIAMSIQANPELLQKLQEHFTQ